MLQDRVYWKHHKGRGDINENVIGDTLRIEATNFSYQEDPSILKQIDAFME